MSDENQSVVLNLTGKSRPMSESQVQGGTAILDLRRRTISSVKSEESSNVPLAVTVERERCISQFEEMSRYIQKQNQILQNIRRTFGAMQGEISNAFEKRGSKLVGFEKTESNYLSKIEELNLTILSMENGKRKTIKSYEKKIEKIEHDHQQELEKVNKEHERILHNTVRNLDVKVQKLKSDWKQHITSKESEWERKLMMKNDHIDRLDKRIEVLEFGKQEGGGGSKEKDSSTDSSSATKLNNEETETKIPTVKKRKKKDPFAIFNDWDSFNLGGSPTTEAFEKLSFDPSSRPVKKIENLVVEKKNKIDLILREFVQTEQDFVDNLTRIIQHFINPITKTPQQPSSSAVVSNIDSQVVINDPKILSGFAKLKTILNINSVFLGDLKKVISFEETNIYRLEAFSVTVDSFSQAFKLYSDYIAFYGEFSLNVSNLMKKNKKFAKYCELKQKEFETLKSRITDLQSYLILPIQRIPRYNLLLKDVLKIVDEYYDEHKSLSKAKEVIHEMAVYTNNKTLEMKNMNRISQLERIVKISGLVQPHRKLIYDAGQFNEDIKKIRDIKKNKISMLKCNCVLLSDLLLVYPLSKPQSVNQIDLTKEDTKIQLVQKGEEINLKKDFVRRDSVIISPTTTSTTQDTIFNQDNEEVEEDENKKKKEDQELGEDLLQRLSSMNKQQQEEKNLTAKSITHKIISVFTSSGAGDDQQSKGWVIIPFHQVKIDFNNNNDELQVRLCFEKRDDAIQWFQRIDQQIKKKRV